MVAALWFRGFPTRWSCEGHPDWGWHAPYVTLAPRIDDERDGGELERWMTSEAARLQGRLDEFYADHDPEASDARLILTPELYRQDGIVVHHQAHMLSNSGRLLGAPRPVEERLSLFQAEMGMFAEYLESI